MPRIVLTTLNARYSHASFGLRYLLANLGELREHAVLREFVIGQPTLQIVGELVGELDGEGGGEGPDIVGFGVYIWNVEEVTAVVRVLRALRPAVRIVLGGPEVSYEYEGTPLFALCDHLITGEGDLAFRDLCRALARGDSPPKVIDCLGDRGPAIEALRLPYDEYTDTDLRQRLIYVEASRGCPFRCEFCLSALDDGVRAFPLPALLEALGRLIDRGARGLKFVDRTFNLSPRIAGALLRFFLERQGERHVERDPAAQRPAAFELHFEMVPDRLPEELRALLSRFPRGAVQLEVGVQSLAPQVLADISRPQRLDRIADNLRFLRDHTLVHVHADLIIGLPGETEESFAAGLNRLLALRPGELQLGFLKRLRGAPIRRHTAAHSMVYSPLPPYEILETGVLSFAALQRLRRFARYFDLYYNSGNFVLTMRRLWGEDADEGGGTDDLAATAPRDRYRAFADFAEWLYGRTGQTHQMALSRLYQLIFAYLVEVRSQVAEEVAADLLLDYDRHQVRRERLEFLRPYAPSVAAPRPGRDALPWDGKRRGQAAQVSPAQVAQVGPAQAAQERPAAAAQERPAQAAQ